jgi:hypothetical protein
MKKGFDIKNELSFCQVLSVGVFIFCGNFLAKWPPFEFRRTMKLLLREITVTE